MKLLEDEGEEVWLPHPSRREAFRKAVNWIEVAVSHPVSGTPPWASPGSFLVLKEVCRWTASWLHTVPLVQVLGFYHPVNLCEMWRGILKQTTLHSFCLLCFFLPIFFFSSLLGLQEGNENICSYQECSSKPVFPPSLPDAMILVKEINSFTGRDT